MMDFVYRILQAVAAWLSGFITGQVKEQLDASKEENKELRHDAQIRADAPFTPTPQRLRDLARKKRRM